VNAGRMASLSLLWCSAHAGPHRTPGWMLSRSASGFAGGLHHWTSPDAERPTRSPGACLMSAGAADGTTGWHYEAARRGHTTDSHFAPLGRGVAGLGGRAGEPGLIRYPAHWPRASRPSVLRRRWRARGTENDLSAICRMAGPPNTIHLLLKYGRGASLQRHRIVTSVRLPRALGANSSPWEDGMG
jgi:hypothetical protein